MGHKVGWVTLHAGIAGGADIILLPEIPYDIDVIAEAIRQACTKSGKKFTIIAVAEGAISKEDAKLSKKELKDKQAKREISFCSLRDGRKSSEENGSGSAYYSSRTYTARRFSVSHMTVYLSTRLGAEAAERDFRSGLWLYAVVKNDKIVRVPLGRGGRKVKIC